uniref:NB-ARC domain-containing protein n=1 Tax=Oryza punctata TaxID=4537 RepID=A0A0E0JHR1_ORYPU
MNSLLVKLTSLLGQEYKLLKGEKDDIKYLRDKMSSMSALLVTLTNMDELSDQQKEWRNKVRELSYDMEDCVDLFMHKISEHHGLVGDTDIHIREFMARVQDAIEQRDRYKLSESVTIATPAHVVSIDPQHLALNEEEDGLVGIESPKQKIIRMLMDDEEGSRKLKVISIVGSAGIGKTTLAKQVYLEIKGRFDCSAFVSLSQNPSMNKIFTRILSQVGFKSRRASHCEYNLIDELKQYLTGMRCGSRVIITTCIEDLGSVCRPNFYGHVYKVEPLNDFDSRILFFRRVFSNEDACPDHLRKVSEEILRMCGGVPLAITSVANILASQGDMMIEKWERILSSRGYELETDPTIGWMRHVLNLSYSNLCPELRTCLLYLSTFPEYCSIRKDDLIKQWIAEGLVTEKFGYDQYEIAESYFNNLIRRSIINPVDIDDCGMVMSCRVHDLMLDLIISKSIEENFIAILDDQHTMRGSHEARRFTLHFNQDLENTEQNLALTRSVHHQTRSISVLGPIQCMLVISEFKYLRLLQIEVYYSYIDSYDLTHMREFFQLRYLRIRGILCKLPEKIGGLKYLETFDIDDNVKNIPSDVCKLSSMAHLTLPKHAKIPSGIDKLVALRTLKASTSYDTSIEFYEGLGSLRKLRELELGATYYMSRDKVVSLAASLMKLGSCSLRSLILRDGDISLEAGDRLNFWSPPPLHLRRLHVFEVVFSYVPDWIAQLDKLTSLVIHIREISKDGFGVLGRLPSLLFLRLDVQSVKENDAVVVCSRTFQYLKEFWYRYKVPCLVFEQWAMPRLRILNIQFDEERLYGGDDGVLCELTGIEHLTNLMEISAHIRLAHHWMCQTPALPRRKVKHFSERHDEDGHGQVEEEAPVYKKAAEAMLKRATGKHPGINNVNIQFI